MGRKNASIDVLNAWGPERLVRKEEGFSGEATGLDCWCLLEANMADEAANIDLQRRSGMM